MKPQKKSAHAMFSAEFPAISRRRFLKKTTAGILSAPLITTAIISAPPNSKLNHACIGVGGMGVADLQNFLQHKKTQIVAICDVDSRFLQEAKKSVPDARTYKDWRELLEKEGDKIDSVSITVPDHMHFPIAYIAIKKGKHVYCQKPMCHDVAEVRALTKLSEKTGVVTQLGTQMASSSGDRTTVRLLNTGAIGKIKHVYLSANRPGAVENYRLKGPRPPGGQEPPPYLDWDLWIGTAPMRTYVPDIYHPVKWRAWLDFGTGWSGDIGCHIFDAVWKGLKLKAPVAVFAKVQESWKNSPERRADTWPQANHIIWTFPANDLIEGNQLTVEWFDGEFYPPREIRALFSVDDYPPESAMVIGTEGALLLILGRNPILLPEEKFKDFKYERLPGRNHYHHFADACLGGEKPESNFSVTGPMTETVLLGTVAVRMPEQTLLWDSDKMKFTNSKQANTLLKRKYRKGWEV